MTKKIIETSKELAKPLTKEEIKERMLEIWTYESHPDNIYKKVSDVLVKPLDEMNEEDKSYLWKYLSKINNFSKNHIVLANTINDDLQTAVIELTNDIIKEYNCTTTLEKSLCETIANSYWKIMSISRKLNNQVWAEYLSKDRVDFIKVLSMELDRANRNYLNALNNLLEIKKPQMSINVKTKNAYFWQNQQFNNNNIQEDENIKD